MMNMRTLYPIAARACAAATLARHPDLAEQQTALENADSCLTDLLAAMEKLDVRTDKDIPPLAHIIGALLHITIGYVRTPLGPTSNAWSRVLEQLGKLLEAEVEEFMGAK